MHNEHTAKTTSDATPSLTRRAMLGGAVAAIGAPMVAAAGPMSVDELAWRLDADAEAAAELPIDRFERHAVEVADVLNEYLDGRFYACIYPSDDHTYPVILKSLAAERRTVEERFEAAVQTLKAVLAEMHPEADEIRHQYAALNNGRSYSFWLVGHAPALGIWDGPGNYEVGDSKDLPAGVYFVDRVWSDMDRGWFFNAAFIFDGKLVGPRERIDPRQIIRKVEGVAV